MKTRYLAATAAAALLFAGLVPATAASAADTTLTGVISGTDGAASDVSVGWVDADDLSTYSTVYSDSEGEYSLDIPESIGAYYLYTNLSIYSSGRSDADNQAYTGEFFGASGQRAFARQLIQPYTAPVDGTLDITLTPSGSITGVSTVYADDYISLETLGDTQVNQTYVDDNGAFSFEGLIPGKYRITAEQTGKYLDYTSAAITVSAGTATEVALAPKTGGSISGVVKNGSKKLSGISVYVNNSENGGYATTSSTGSYSVKGLSSGNYTVTFGSYSTGSSKQYVTKTVSAKGVKTGATKTVNASLATAGLITGKVKKTSGAEYYEAYAYNSSSKKFAGYTSGSSSTKSFSIGSLAAGKYTVYFLDGKQKYYGKTSVTVKAGKSASVGTEKLARKTVTLAGKVTGATSGYVSAYTSSLPGGSSQISSSGKYSIKGLVPATYTVAVSAANSAEKTSTVKVPKSTTKNLAKGSSYGKYTGKALVNGSPIDYGYGYYTIGSSASSEFTIEAGSFSGSGKSGTAKLDYLYTGSTALPGNSPYWYDFPAAAKSFTLKSGATKVLGTFELDLLGVPADPIR